MNNILKKWSEFMKTFSRITVIFNCCLLIRFLIVKSKDYSYNGLMLERFVSLENVEYLWIIHYDEKYFEKYGEYSRDITIHDKQIIQELLFPKEDIKMKKSTLWFKNEYLILVKIKDFKRYIYHIGQNGLWIDYDEYKIKHNKIYDVLKELDFE